MSHDTSTTAGKAAVMLAADKGATIECKMRSFSEWRQTSFPVWNWEACDYRVKPEPLTVWVNIYSDGCLGGPSKSAEMAESTRGPGFLRVAKFVEVIQ